MPEATESPAKPIIAMDKKSLDGFVLDISAYTLDKAQYKPADYAFHLHVALRRQAILQEDLWNQISQDLSQDNPLTWDSEAKLKKINAFVQAVVNEVREASLEPWGMRLVKTSFLSFLDKARAQSEKALEQLKPPTSEVSRALEAHIEYLDSLLVLPFLIEKLCLKISAGTKHNYEPKKNAAVLASILDTLQYCTVEETRIMLLKQAVKIAMPTLPVDSKSLDTIAELLPHIEKLSKNAQALEKAKEKIYLDADPQKQHARSALLSAMGVQLDSLQCIAQNTLLGPMQQCIDVATNMQGMAQDAALAYQSDNYLDKVANIASLFAKFDAVARVSSQIDPGLLPPQIQEANRYYEECRAKAESLQDMVGDAANSVVDAAYQGFGRFYEQIRSFIPESIQWYFKLSVDNLTGILGHFSAEDGYAHLKEKLDYLAFYELAEKSDWNESLLEKFFLSYMAEVSKNSHQSYTYARYKELVADKQSKLKSLVVNKLPLVGLMQQFNKATADEEKENILVAMLHRLKTLEIQHQNGLIDQDVILLEMQNALDFDTKTNHALQELKNRFLLPGAKSILNTYLNKNYKLHLENIIDDAEQQSPFAKANLDALKEIYYKINANHLITYAECLLLNKAYENKFALSPNIMRLTAILEGQLPPLEEKPALKRTPNEEMAQTIQDNFASLQPVIQQIIAELNKQQAHCLHLQNLSGEGSGLYDLCQKKIDYITAIKTAIQSVQADVAQRSPELAKHLSSLLSGEKLTEASQVVNEALDNKMALVEKSIRFAWHVCPNLNENNDLQKSFLNNLMAYAFTKDNNVAVLNKAHQEFTDCAKSNIFPELMYFLNDPLTVANMIPGQEKIMDKVVEQVLGLSLEKNSMFSWAKNFLGNQVSSMVASITPETLSKLFPYPFLGQLAYQVIQNATVQARMGQIMGSLAAEYGAGLGDKAFDLAQAAKQRFYLLLGVEIQRSLEERALAHANKDNPDLSVEAQDAFALFYLRYRALRQNNPERANARECAAFLLRGHQSAAVLASKFEEVDQVNNLLNASDKIIDQLTFLISNLNFSDPENRLSIRLALINNYLLMAFESQTDRRQAILQLSQVLDLAATVGPESKEEHPALQALDASRKRVKDLYQKELDASRTLIGAFLKRELDDKQEQLDSEAKEGNPPRLGENVHAYHLKAATKERRFYVVLSRTAAFLSFAALWGSIIAPLVAFGTSEALLQAFLVFFGATAIVGASATVVGAVIFGIVVLVRFGVKATIEIWGHRQDFNKIAETEPNGFMRALKYLGLTLKCLGIALAKTFISDYFVGKIKNAFYPVVQIKTIADRFPSKEKISRERDALQEVRDKLSALPNPEDPHFASAFEALKTAMDKAKTELDKRSTTDCRNHQGEYLIQLEQYWAKFAELNALNDPVFLRHVKLAKVVAAPAEEKSAAPKLEEPQAPAAVQQPENLVENYHEAHEALLGQSADVLQGSEQRTAVVVDDPGYLSGFISNFYAFIGGLYANIPTITQTQVQAQPQPIAAHPAAEEPSLAEEAKDEPAALQSTRDLAIEPPPTQRMQLQREASKRLLGSMENVLHAQEKSSASKRGFFGRAKSSAGGLGGPKPPMSAAGM